MLTLLLLAQIVAVENLPLEQGDPQATFVYVQEKPLAERVMVAALVASASADAVFSARCLHAGTCREANPALSWAARRGPVMFIATKALGTVAVLMLCDWLADRGHSRAAAIVGWSVTGVWTFAAARAATY